MGIFERNSWRRWEEEVERGRRRRSSSRSYC